MQFDRCIFGIGSFVAVPNIFSPITYTMTCERANVYAFIRTFAFIMLAESFSSHSSTRKIAFFALLLLHKQHTTRYFPLIIITYFSLSDSIAILLKLQTYLIKRVSSKQYIQYYFSVCSLSCRIQWLHSSCCRCWRLL